RNQRSRSVSISTTVPQVCFMASARGGAHILIIVATFCRSSLVKNTLRTGSLPLFLSLAACAGSRDAHDSVDQSEATTTSPGSLRAAAAEGRREALRAALAAPPSPASAAVPGVMSVQAAASGETVPFAVPSWHAVAEPDGTISVVFNGAIEGSSPAEQLYDAM